MEGGGGGAEGLHGWRGGGGMVGVFREGGGGWRRALLIWTPFRPRCTFRVRFLCCEAVNY